MDGGREMESGATRVRATACGEAGSSDKYGDARWKMELAMATWRLRGGAVAFERVVDNREIGVNLL